MDFSNPVPIAVALVAFDNKLVGIRREIEPRKGHIAFPLHADARIKFYSNRN